jgi:hypothetical protein
MKTTIRIASWIGILAGVVWLLITVTPDQNAGTRISERVFTNFPVGRDKKVEFAWGGGALRHLSQREEKDQSLDWLLMGLLSDSGISTDEMGKVAFDLPPVRVGYFHAIGTFEYGTSRSRYLGNGRVVALVPEESDQQRGQTLARIADEQRKNTGKIPTTLLVFEYRLDPDHQHAHLLRRPDAPGQNFYSEAAGYREKRIESQADLQDFLNATNDLTYAKLDNGALILGGRSLPETFLNNSRKITLNDIAALCQSEQSVKAVKAQIDAFEAKWRNATYRTEWEKEGLIRQMEKERTELKAKLSADRAATSSGFSLDPTFDYDGLSGALDRLDSLLRAFATPETISKIKVGLENKDEGPLFELLDQMDQDPKNKPFTELLDGLINRYKFQAARYDGDLRGTEVGMTLFYTDLLAKLKALDYWSQSPVPDFIPMTQVHLSPVYDKELDVLRNTRLWFGPLDQGYQNAGDSLLFARNSTRIYAASSNPYTPGKEVEPNAESAYFLGWWNDHYEEVAAYEPEYQRLNEIMKWSLLVTWFNQSSSSASALNLADYKVDHSCWFPQWIHSHPQLRYTNWSRIHFYPPHYKGAKTETMPLLVSEGYRQNGREGVLMGGVSLASEDVIRSRAVLPKAVEGTEQLGLRSGVDYADFESSGMHTLKTLDQTEYVFADESGGIVSTVSKARPAAKFRGADTELANLQVDRQYVKAGSELKIDVKVGDSRFGEFSSISSDSELRIGFHELEIDRAHDLAEQTSAALAKHDEPEKILAHNPDVQYLIGMDCDGCYAIKLRGSDRWLKLAKDPEPSVNLKEGWQARVAALDYENSPTVNLAFVEQAKIQGELQSARYVHLSSDPEGQAGVTMSISNRGPPQGATPVDVEVGGVKVRGSRGSDGTIYVSRDQLPDALGGNPEKLVAAIDTHRRDANPLIDDIRSDDFRRAADQIAADPTAAKQAIIRASKRVAADADQALRAGDDAKAARDFDLVIQLSGPSPDLLARRAIAEAKFDPQQAVESIRQALRGSAESPDSIFQVVNARLSRGDLTPAEAENMKKIASMLDLRNYREGQNLTDVIIPDFENGRIDFRVRLAGEVKSDPVQIAQAGPPDGPVYVLDDPGLRTNDPVTQVVRPLDMTLERELGKTVRLPRFDLAWAKPHVIETSDGRKWVRVEQSMSGLRAPLNSYTRMPSQSNCPGQLSEPCPSYIYLREPIAQRSIAKVQMLKEPTMTSLN